MADSISAIEPNQFGLALSKALRYGRDALNYPGKLPEKVPLVGGMGLGDFMWGHAPEAVEDYSYGFGPFHKGSGMTTQMDPRMVDIAFMPTLGAGGAVKGTGKLLSNALRKAPMEATDMSRRNFLKGAGAVTAGAAATLAVPDLAKSLMKGVGSAAEEAAPAIGRAAGAQAAKMGIGELASTLGTASRAWIAKHGAEWIDNNDWVEYTPEMFNESAKHLAEHPDLPKALEEALGGMDPAKVDPDFLNKIQTSASHRGFEGGSIHQIYDFDAINRGSELLKDPKHMAQFEELFLTGKLPAGAPEELTHVGIYNLPNTSKFTRLRDLASDAQEHAIEQVELNKQAKGAEIAADPKRLAEYDEYMKRASKGDITQPLNETFEDLSSYHVGAGKYHDANERYQQAMADWMDGKIPGTPTTLEGFGKTESGPSFKDFLDY
jgi:hypothetical protein